MPRFSMVVLLCWIALAVAVPAGFAGADAPAAVNVNPSVLNVGTFFSGGQVEVSGEIPAEDDVVIEIIGPQVNSLFDIKGRIGLFWMTRAKVDLENAPALYILLLPEGPQWAQRATGFKLGIDSMEDKIGVSPSDTASEEIFRMFVKLKRSESLYSELPDAVSYSTGENGRRRFTAMCRLPSSTAVGKYTVRATRISNMQISGQLSADLTVQQVGFVKMVDTLASDRRLTYGVSAVLIALISGALMGLVFKGGGGH